MLKEIYVVLFEGKVRERESKREVKKRLMDCFHTDEAAVDRLFSGQRMIVFRSETRNKADDFAKRFAATGALCRIEIEFDECPDGDQPEAPGTDAPRDTSIDKGEGGTYHLLQQAYAGPRGEWYANHFKRFSSGGRTSFAITWNWCAFLFGIVWLLYRKMYGMALIFFSISLVGIVIPGSNLFISLFLGFSGNYFYFRHTEKKVIAIISGSEHIDPDRAMAELGGVNPIAKVLAIFLIMIGIAAFLGSSIFDLANVSTQIP